MEKFVDRMVSGWAGYPRSSGRLYRPERISGILSILRTRKQHSYIGRGQGRSYGDAALNEGGGLILTDRLNRFLSFDPTHGLLTCEAGLTLREILETMVPRGWFLPVTPGTKSVSVAGALACDVHGKNHHKDGSLSNFVRSFDLLLADGRQVCCSEDENSDLFWATIGGLGLTGMILGVTLQLRPIETAFIRVDYRRTADLEETMRALEEEDHDYTYSVAWIDVLASKRRLGRSILIRGNHAGLDELPAAQSSSPLQLSPRLSLTVPFHFPGFVLNGFSIRNFNRLYYRRLRQDHSSAIVDYDRFFYPLDALNNWNRMYGRRGFVQYQCVFPFETSQSALPEILRELRSHNVPVFLAVLKRFGAEAGLLSFPRPGYTLALDMPISGRQFISFLHELDRLVIRYGGRVYLGKDACLSAQSFREMYPRLADWLRIKTAVDPQNLFSSDLARRLRITPSEV